MINILADKDLYHLNYFLPENVKLIFFDANEGLRAIPEEVQALLLRTVTKINPKTFPSLPKVLAFIGTGSAGTDHIDLPYLKEKGIAFASAPGCNARSVAEYVATSLLIWANQLDVNLTSCRIGIIGVGHAGSEVEKLLRALGIKAIAYDPPRQQREPEFKSAALEEVLACDILTFHTPLTFNGAYATHHWLDKEKLESHRYKLIINAARGGVIDEKALLEAYKNKQVENYILDVWEDEPLFRDKTARHAYIKTPHIAGYSVQAKERASMMIVDALCTHFSLEPKKVIPSLQAMASLPKKPMPFWSLTDVLTYYHPIKDYETRFLLLIGRSPEAKKDGFNRIRATQPLRNEFITQRLSDKEKNKFPILKTLFFDE